MTQFLNFSRFEIRAPRYFLILAVVAGLTTALLLFGIYAGQPYLPIAAGAFFLIVWLWLQIPLRIIQVAIIYLPWAIFLNLGENFPLISVYVLVWMALLKTLLISKTKVIPKIFFVLLGFGMYLLLSAIFIGNPIIAISKIFHWFHFLIFYAVLRINLDQAGNAERILHALLISFLVNSLVSVALYFCANHVLNSPDQYLQNFIYPLGKLIYGTRGFDFILENNNWLTESGALKALGFIFNPTQASLIALMEIGLAMFLLLDPPRGISKKKLWINLGSGLIYLILSSGRSGFVVFPVIALFWIVAYKNISGLKIKAGQVLLSILILGGSGFALWEIIVMNFRSITSLDYYSNAGRFLCMSAGLVVATHAGWWGFGFGNTPSVMELKSASNGLQGGIADAIASISYNFKSVIADSFYSQTNYHSLILDLIVQTGIIGFLFCIIVLVSLAKSGNRKYPAMQMGNAAILVAFSFSQIVGGDIFYPKVMLFLVTIVACAETCISPRHSNEVKHE